MKSERALSTTQRALALALVLGLSVSCGDDDGPTGNNGGTAGGPLGDFAALIDGTVEKYFENNEAAFLSLGTFAPSFQGVLSIAPAVAGPASGASLLQQGCIDPAIHGTTYEFDFGQNTYVAGQMTGAPNDGVRFLLYDEGQQANGHVDVRCPGDLPTINISITIVWDGVTVYGMTATGTINLSSFAWSVSTSGTMTDPQSNDVLSINTSGSGVGTELVASGFDYTNFTDDLTVQFGKGTQSGFLVGGLALKGLSQQTFEWNVTLAYSGASAQSLSGHVELHSLEGGSGTAACLSGTYETVTVSEASACADDIGLPPFSGVTGAHRAAIGAGYGALRLMLETLTGVLQTGIEAAISSVG